MKATPWKCDRCGTSVMHPTVLCEEYTPDEVRTSPALPDWPVELTPTTRVIDVCSACLTDDERMAYEVDRILGDVYFELTGEIPW